MPWAGAFDLPIEGIFASRFGDEDERMLLKTETLAIPESPPSAAVEQELLQLLSHQGWRVPAAILLIASMIAGMISQVAPLWVSGLWLASVCALMVLRHQLFSRLPQLDRIPLRRRLQWVTGLSGVNGLLFSSSLLFAPQLSPYQHMVLTMLLLGLCAGAIASTAGYLPVLLAFLLPVTLANSLAWVSGGAAMAADQGVKWLLGGLILAFSGFLIGQARDAYRLFVESVQIRQQQVRTNEQLRLALQQAESAGRAKTRFLASASHDLRQPMHTLTLFGAALMTRPLDAASADIGRHMNLALQSLASQMDGLLDISKLDAQVVPVNKQRFSLQRWLERLCQELQPQAQRKGLQLSLDCPPEAFVETDPQLLDRLLRNLLDNAIKYTAQGHVSVAVVASPEGEAWCVSIADSGCGIAAAEQERIFEEYYQISNPEHDRSKGLGLGLSIVSRLAGLLDLPLSLQSKPGEGSRFSLGIGAAAAPDLLLAKGPLARLSQLQVLVLDDELPVRLAMQALLSAHGCTVTLAASTREALLQSLQRRPDLLLTDLRLGAGDDGLIAVRSLRALLPRLPVVLISGDTAPERLREAHAAGLPLLHKPVLEEQLLQAIDSAISNKN